MADNHGNKVVRAAYPYLKHFNASVVGALESASVEKVESIGNPEVIGAQFESAREMMRNLANELKRDYHGFIDAESKEEAKRKIDQDYDTLLRYSDIAEKFVSGQQPDMTGVPPDHLKVTLEGIIKTDGTRPTFLIKNNKIVPDPAWPQAAATNAVLASNTRAKLETWIPSIGRIGRPPTAPNDDSFVGTGWLVGENVILTNRHVMEAAFRRSLIPSPEEIDGVFIDFGKESRIANTPGVIYSANVRRLTKVLFAGPKAIRDRIGHGLGLLDVVAFEVTEPENPTDESQLPIPLSFDLKDLLAESKLATIGFPLKLRDGVAQDVVDAHNRIFGPRLGIKQLAPGEVRESTTELVDAMNPNSRGHDASTLGGNSGSPVFQTTDGSYAFGIHYGGGNGELSSNYAHIIGEILDTPGAAGLPYRTLRSLLQDRATGVHVDLFKAVPPGG